MENRNSVSSDKIQKDNELEKSPQTENRNSIPTTDIIYVQEDNHLKPEAYHYEANLRPSKMTLKHPPLSAIFLEPKEERKAKHNWFATLFCCCLKTRGSTRQEPIQNDKKTSVFCK